MTHLSNKPQEHNLRIERALLVALLAAFLTAATLYSIVVPMFEVSDELWHYPMVRTLAEGNGLPVQDPANIGPWRQEGSQPPLYYAIGAAATFWIDTSDADLVRRQNPHHDIGIITQDGNINMVTHDAQLEAWPWHGTTLAVHLVRLISVILSTASVYFTYRIGLEVFPNKRWLALAGAALAAFTPMFVFISGSVNNDNLAVLLSTIAIWLLLRLAQQARLGHPTLRWSAALGIVLGLGALTKQSTLGLFALAGLTMAYTAWRQRRWQTFFLEGPLIVGIAAAIAGWWYMRNWQLYGDPLGLNMFVAIAGPRPGPTSLLQLWGERVGFVWSYWGFFGGLSVPMPLWVYRSLNALAGLSVIGVAVVIVQNVRHEGFSWENWFPVGLTLLWIPGVLLPLLRWSSMTSASQGRLMFSALAVLSLWFAAGIGGWLPGRWGKVAAGAVAAYMGTLTFVAPFAWIAPHYQPPPQVDVQPNGTTYDFTPPGATEPVMRLVNAEVLTRSAQPGGSVRVRLTWRVLAPMQLDWSTFVHLADSVQLLAGQRDTYPGLGTLATSELTPGREWQDLYVVPVSETAYAPEALSVVVGLYDLDSGVRMHLDNGGDLVTVGNVSLEPRESAQGIPNKTSINFGNQLELIGYQLDRRQIKAGDSLTVTLFWQGLSRMDENYSVSVQVLGDGATKVAQKDGWPQDGQRPTVT